jgi:hypothetical protein
LAFAPPDIVEMTIRRGLRPYTSHTVTSPDRFRRALAIVRVTRAAVTRYELEAQTCTVAMPVFGPGGDAVAAVELTVPDLGVATLEPDLTALTLATLSLARELIGRAIRRVCRVRVRHVGSVTPEAVLNEPDEPLRLRRRVADVGVDRQPSRCPIGPRLARRSSVDRRGGSVRSP